MTGVEVALREAIDHLTGLGIRYALIGGFAVSVYAEPRFTRDVDLAVAVAGDAEAEALIFAMRERGYGVVASIDHLPTGRLGTVRLHGPAAPSIYLDLLFASSGLEPEIVAGARRVEVLPGLVIPVASPGHLVALKLLARDDASRPQDAGDLLALGAVLDDGDRREAREGIELIAARGFHRDRDLRALLAAFLGHGPVES